MFTGTPHSGASLAETLAYTGGVRGLYRGVGPGEQVDHAQYIHTNIYKYIHAYIHTYIHTCTHNCTSYEYTSCWPLMTQ
jgi:hypothetical protein